ncbi:hypothetical protein LMG26842_05491 [Achromobacter dolens]|jgi:hypothetical protein|nr:hypothetical protein LMG26842_05491 [Achromobacter dolens]
MTNLAWFERLKELSCRLYGAIVVWIDSMGVLRSVNNQESRFA